MSSICCLPCVRSAVGSIGSKVCSRSFCTYVDMTPPLLALVASIVALSAALYWHSYMLCAPATVGILGSCYATFTAYKARDLASLQDTVTSAEQQVAVLRQQNITLEGNNQTFQQENMALHENVASVRQQFEEQRLACETQLTSLHTAIEEVNAGARETLRLAQEEHLKATQQREEQHTTAMLELQTAATDREQELKRLQEHCVALEAFSTHLKSVMTQLESRLEPLAQLQELCSSQGHQLSSFEQTGQLMGTHTLQLERVCSELATTQEVFVNLKKVFEALDLDRQLQLQANLHQRAEQLVAYLACLETQVTFMSEEADHLKRVRTDLTSEVNRFSEETSRLETLVTTATVLQFNSSSPPKNSDMRQRLPFNSLLRI